MSQTDSTLDQDLKESNNDVKNIDRLVPVPDEDGTTNSKEGPGTCPDELVFKKPSFIGKFPKFGKPNVKKQSSSSNVNVEVQIGVRKDFDKDPENDAPPVLLKKSPAQQITAVIPYKEPPWSGLPKNDYHLEVLKGGIIVDTLPLVKPFIVIGRLAQCDILMEHPSISRFHCVLQYRSEGTVEEPVGYYVYDLDSTHGSYLNGHRLKPLCYQRVHVGHFLKIGGSTRMYFLQGPEVDEQPESELTVTELKMRAAERASKLEKLENNEYGNDDDNKNEKKNTSASKDDSESDGINWGMDEDAIEENPDEDEECELSVTTTEELNLEDPKKTLRGWFEREGYDLPNYEANEIRPGKFSCRVELPVESPDGKAVIATIEHTGKKKDAVVQCALEACTILNRHGVLRQAKHESHKKKKKDWSNNDYYDSDEDDYLDRTGDIQRKRIKRMNEGAAENAPVMTYDSLLEQYNKVVSELSLLEKRLVSVDKLKQQQLDVNEERQYTHGTPGDELDAFMERLKSQVPDKHKRVAWKLKIVDLRKEELRIRKLVNVARPSNIPQVEPYEGNTESDKGTGQLPRSVPTTTNKLSLGSKLFSGKVAPKPSSHLNQARLLGIHKAFIEEEPEQRKLTKLTDAEDIQPVPYAKSDDDPPIRRTKTTCKPVEMSQLLKPYEHKHNLFKSKSLTSNPENIIIPEKLIQAEVPQCTIPQCPVPSTAATPMETHEDQDEQILEDVAEEVHVKKQKIIGPTLPVIFDRQKTLPKTLDGVRKAKSEKSAYKVIDDKYETWTPPPNQSGDGRTKLNEKYGY